MSSPNLDHNDTPATGRQFNSTDQHQGNPEERSWPGVRLNFVASSLLKDKTIILLETLPELFCD